MRVYVAEIPKDHDHINHLGLRSALENEDIIPCFLTIGPGDIIAENEDGSNPVVFNYKYHRMVEYQEDCKILNLSRPELDKSKLRNNK